MDSIFAYVKYEGESVENGYLDARKAGEALIGIDLALRYFINHENPELQKIVYEIPVRVRKGSWEAIFQENFDQILISAGIFWAAKQYVGPALSEMAKNDFKDIGFKDIFKNAFKAMTWVIKLATHLGTLNKKSFENIVFSDNNKLIGVRNQEGKLLWIPVEYLEQFAHCPDSLFNKLAKAIDNERVLVVGYAESSMDNVKIEARVNLKSKLIFLQEENSEEELFPELKHNDFVELYGYITRGNEKANNLGFLYSGHILTCYPNEGNIKNYRQALFNNCLIRGYVERIDKNGHAQKRPSIKFSSISINDPRGNQLRLF